MSAYESTGEFTIEMTPAEGLIEGTSRFDFSKLWTGAVDGTSAGVMMSGGDPAVGEAGYVAMERFEGTVDGRAGSVAFQQIGAMSGGEASMSYAVVPGSGTHELAGMEGEIDLDTAEGHRVTLRYTIPD
ncbi:DUF3224 domain-containing protein [Nostocoides australiense]|nr:DUF3224 domain-containing protein [Tetrasphaera sp.]HPF82445.1 DUF3224 domain-containing protein [Tetrasphaera australiensis]